MKKILWMILVMMMFVSPVMAEDSITTESGDETLPDTYTNHIIGYSDSTE